MRPGRPPPGPRPGGLAPHGGIRGIRAAVFDTDGVLTDTARLHAAAWKEAFGPFSPRRGTGPGGRSTPSGTIRATSTAGPGSTERATSSARGARPTEEQVRAVASAKERAYPARLGTDGAGVRPVALRLPGRLRSRARLRLERGRPLITVPRSDRMPVRVELGDRVATARPGETRTPCAAGL
ncbi:hypothetical protein ABZ714_10620 [Streptomyces sp. NPDC006798]|uniref:hypothetical protein n=1 Tax=Streptomyces sp. NPDC006798 TaxID=3155462 RepID=UPI0033EC73F1